MREEETSLDARAVTSPATPFEMIAAAIVTNAIVSKTPAGPDPIQEAKQVYTRMLRYIGRLK